MSPHNSCAPESTQSQPPPTRQTVFDAISRERAFQEWKRGPNHCLDVGAWLTVIRCELRESEEAWTKGHPDCRAALQEILQVAAVAVACLEQHGVHERGQS